MWQGVDPVDGSEVLRSIIKNKDHTFSLIGTETHFVGCNRGKVEGTGGMENGIIVFDTYRLVCFGEDYSSSDDDISYPLDVKIIPDRLNRTITEDYGPDWPAVVLHRISK